MKIKKEAKEIWNEYNQGVQYKTTLDLYDTVEQNENFYNDKQWEGVKAPDLPKPVMNFLKPVVNYYVAMLISDDISTNIEVVNSAGFHPITLESNTAPMMEAGMADSAETVTDRIPNIISTEISNIMERANVKFKNRLMVRNCAVDGDGCFYVWFDVDAETGFDYRGEIKVDLIDNTNIYFGNPSEAEAQDQPYIIIAYRKLTYEVKDEAKENGKDPDLVKSDNETQYMNADKDTENSYTTVLLKMWKEEGTVHIIKSTQEMILKDDTDTGYKLYPVAWMNWERVKNSYHGQAPITGKIQNQIAVNKIMAMVLIHVQNDAFPKVLYDRTKIDKWDNRVGTSVAVNGNPNDALFSSFKPSDMSATAPSMMDTMIQQTKDLMGASDAALGNVKPDNTSAIIAVQQAAGLPLDIQKKDFYHFVESYVRIFIDMMRVNYGTRSITLDGAGNTKELVEFDFNLLDEYMLNLDIDIGQAAIYSEVAQISTLDNLYDRGMIPNPLIYLDAIPNGYIKNKDKIIQGIKETMNMQTPPGSAPAMPVQEQQGMPMPPEMAMAPEGAALPQNAGLTEKEMMQVVSELVATMDMENATKQVDMMDIPNEQKVMIMTAYEQAVRGGVS